MMFGRGHVQTTMLSHGPPLDPGISNGIAIGLFQYRDTRSGRTNFGGNRTGTRTEMTEWC